MIWIVEDPRQRVTEDGDRLFEERREIIIGHSTRQRLLLVWFTERRKRIQVIGARQATRQERKDYEEEVL